VRERGRRGKRMSHTLVELLKTFELRSEATLAGSVDDEDDLALELGKIIDVTLLCALLSVSLSHTPPSRYILIKHTVQGLELVEAGSRRHVGRR
jgi:hypothetical protein